MLGLHNEFYTPVLGSIPIHEARVATLYSKLRSRRTTLGLSLAEPPGLGRESEFPC